MNSFRRSAGLIFAAALLPLLLFAVFQIGFSAREQRRSIEASALSDAALSLAAADTLVARVQGILDALTTARSVDEGDWPGFASRARGLTQNQSIWAGVALIDSATDRLLVDTRNLPFGTAPTGANDTVLRTGPGCPCIVLDRLAVGPNGRRLTVRAYLSTEPFLAQLPLIGGNRPVSALVTSQGIFIARSLAQSERVGTPASIYVRNAASSGRWQGLYHGRTLEGVEIYTAFARSRLTGWSTHVALPARYIDAPSRTFFRSLGVAAVLSLALAGLLIAFALRQIAEARRFAERLQQAQKLEALGQLTGGIAHDFNNLLTPIVGALDWLRRSPDLPARGQRLAAGALASAERASKLTAQLLAFSRRQKLRRITVDIETVMTDMESLLEQTVGKTHRLVLSTDPDVGCVRTDPTQLEVAILNLVLNARDASPDGTPITVRARAAPTAASGPADVLIEVADEGSGMDLATRDRAFELFFTTKEPGKGTGLGLAQVLTLAKHSEGDVTIDTAPGRGTTVTLRLPGSSEKPEPAVPETLLAEQTGLPTRTLRLLVVDDDPAVRSAIARPLEDLGHSVDSVASGATALAALAAERFDLIVSDYAMPGMDGAELIGRARAIQPDARFLIVTGYADTGKVEEACPDTELLFKPFTPDQLIAAVNRLATALIAPSSAPIV